MSSMERRSKRLAEQQREKPISYRETKVKRIFKKVCRKHIENIAVEKRQKSKTCTESSPQRDWGAKSRDLEDQPSCELRQPRSKSCPDIFEQLLKTHTGGIQGTGGRISGFSCMLQYVKTISRPVNRPSPMVKILPLLLNLFLGFILISFSGFLKISFRISVSHMDYEQLRFQNEALRNFEKELFALHHQVYMQQSLTGAPVILSKEAKNSYMQMGSSEEGNKHNLKKDFALKSAGASVIKSSQSYSREVMVCKWGFCWVYSRSPDVILEWDEAPGNCWAMNGSEGYIVIKLSQEICPTYVTLDHISRNVSYTEEISCAPKDFSVYGLKNLENTFLGMFSYRIDGSHKQDFNLQVDNSKKFEYLQIRIFNNWGHPNYTCIYGVRIHGEESC